MAARRIIQRRNILPVAAGIATAALVVFPTTYAYAESPAASQEGLPGKKPIYDDPTAPPSSSSPSANTGHSKRSTDEELQVHKSPTPTDRLAVHVRTARLALYDLSARTEDGIDRLLSRVLNAETSLANTVAGLAPPPASNERVLPGLTYVLVSMLAGSIVTRNRNILLRFSLPVAVGLGTAYYVLPYTMDNVGELVWSYEKQFPELAKRHERISERTKQIWETSKDHTALTVHLAEEQVDKARTTVEDWVRKGK